MNTEGNVVIITGASQGIGAELVRAYRDRNFRVIVTSRSITPRTYLYYYAVSVAFCQPPIVDLIVRARIGL
ncbi:SDR family NAD(P)-dependent oxidoreductase, partial [Rhizobium sp. SEMIA 4085]|uniref:SDR family NAD(P)-dependent oxidoreductase n=1 Tax=Rhizobium sp. SEMIA 4085 TaxID=2137761 RepID=UPI0014795C63